jgi:DNA-binding NarL/FixJ family response regulator
MVRLRSQDVIRVFLIDDEAIVRSALASLIRSWEGFQISGEATVDEAIEQLRSVEYDVALLSLAGSEDVDRVIVRDLSRICGSSPLVVLVGDCDESFRQQVARLGANRVLMKTEHPRTLQKAIRDLYETFEPDLPARLIS